MHADILHRPLADDAATSPKTTLPLAIGAFIIAFIVGAIALAGPGSLPTPPSLQPGALQAPIAAHPAQAAANPYVYSDVAERAVKSVVSITTSKLMRPSSRSQHGPGGFFGPWGPPRGQHRIPQQFRQGAGSGVIVRADGVVLTNNHVIAHSDRIRVQLADRRTFDAEVIGSDPKTDVAVLKLKGKVGKLDVLPLADSDKVRLGEVVLAIGNSFGRLNHTVTMGIVSAKGRGNVGIVDYEDFIQTDAAINPGNSGGALVNMRGELLGINTAIASRSGGSQGVGFAIPANMARSVMSAILDHGQVDRGWLGVVIQDMDDAMVQAFKSGDRGVLIGDVAPGSPAAKAKLQRGDVVLMVNGKRVDNTARLRNMVALAGSGAKVTLQVVRAGKSRDVKVKLARAPGQRKVAHTAQKQAADERIGMTLQPLDDDARRKFRIGRDVRHGVVVADVQPGSIAAGAGMQSGDVLIEVGRAPFKDIDAAVKRIEAARGPLLLTVRRGEHNMYLLLRLE